jgi:hypothetical protein
MQADGNAVLYASGRAVWNSRTGGNAGARLVMQNDGNLVVYAASGKALWASAASRTPSPSPTPPANPGNSKNCGDFSTWRAAQDWFDTYFRYYGDVARLDSDGDRIVCETLPGAP